MLRPLALALLVVPALAFARDPTVGRGINLYEYGDYDACIKTLDGALTAGVADKADRQAARLYLASAYDAQGDVPKARATVRALVAEDPLARADPALFPPRFVELFNDVKEQERAKLAAQHGSQWQPQLGLTPQTRERASLGVTLVPFGVGQFANGSPGKGAFFLVSELAAFGTFAVTFSAFEAKRTDPGGLFCTQAVPCQFGSGTAADQSSGDRLQTFWVASFWTGVALAAVGVGEAVLDR